jgi:hypothetical protein|tara:strand:+ start:387 stop:830 length:444 start_codon:yes stop_codon:yes gene_type:complete
MNLYGMKDYKRVRETHLDHKPNGNGYRFREENEEDNKPKSLESYIEDLRKEVEKEREEKEKLEMEDNDIVIGSKNDDLDIGEMRDKLLNDVDDMMEKTIPNNKQKVYELGDIQKWIEFGLEMGYIDVSKDSEVIKWIKLLNDKVIDL